MACLSTTALPANIAPPYPSTLRLRAKHLRFGWPSGPTT
jgi:hypothetical protein